MYCCKVMKELVQDYFLQSDNSIDLFRMPIKEKDQEIIETMESEEYDINDCIVTKPIKISFCPHCGDDLGKK